MNYPFEALEEALANAVYHKNYEIREPIEVRVLPGAIEIISFGGPDPSIRKRDLDKGIIRARRYRNRRIGEFLKELNLTKGKGTGIPTIKKALKENGSPPPQYDTDGEERRFFIAEIPVHEHFNSQDDSQDDSQVSAQVIDRVMITLNFCKEPKSRIEILDNLGLATNYNNFKNNVLPAIEAGLLEMTIPDKPQSGKQRYKTTPKALNILKLK